MLYKLGALLIALAAAAYAVNYARWALRQRLIRGAVGLLVLAAASLGLPLYLLLTR